MQIPAQRRAGGDARGALHSPAGAGLDGAGSDFDVLIVIPQSDVRRMDVARAARRLTRDLPCDIDVVVRFENEFDERAAWPSTIEAAVKRHGRILHG